MWDKCLDLKILMKFSDKYNWKWKRGQLVYEKMELKKYVDNDKCTITINV